MGSGRERGLGKHSGKGKKGFSQHKPIKSVYAAGGHFVLKRTSKAGQGKSYPRVKRSMCMNPVNNNVLREEDNRIYEWLTE